jgi:hypothetical protein
MRVAIILLTVLIGRMSAAQQYFPPGVFDSDSKKDQSYSRHLRALQEPSLWKESLSNKNARVYRFLWLRSFHHPISARLEVKPDGSSVLFYKVCNGTGGYGPGKLARTKTLHIAKPMTDDMADFLREAGFWDLPPIEQVAPDVVRVDGAQWILEGVENGRYHVVDRWSPDGIYKELCLQLAMVLPRIRMYYDEVY